MEIKNEEENGEVVALSSPRLSALEKLYVRTYLHTLSHPKAYEAINPGLKNYPSDNQYSRKANVQFHINLTLQERAESLSITPEAIIEKLWKEGLREGAGSNHAARIQALTQLGKHLGLFVEKKESTAHTFNIITYSDSPVKVEEVKEEVVKEDNNITFTDYGDIGS